MTNSSSTYKKVIFGKLLGIYLIANFSLPLMEGVHFLLHLGDDTTLHSYSSHSKIHAHTSLKIIGKIINNQESENTTTTESIAKVKKNIQFCKVATKFTFAPISISTQGFIFISNYFNIPFLSLPAPPPKSKYLL